MAGYLHDFTSRTIALPVFCKHRMHERAEYHKKGNSDKTSGCYSNDMLQAQNKNVGGNHSTVLGIQLSAEFH